MPSYPHFSECVHKGGTLEFCYPSGGGLVTNSCQTLVGHQAPLSKGFPGKNTRMSCHFLLQGIFLTRDRTHISYISSGFFTAEPPVNFVTTDAYKNSTTIKCYYIF